MHLDRRRLERAMDAYLERCFAAKSAARVSEFAGSLGVSRSYLARLFPRVLGQTVLQALRARQVVRAEHLLTTTELPTSEIARSAAFGTQATFFRVYSSLRSITPDAFRERWTK
jgi:AraC-like DNA-binding protein